MTINIMEMTALVHLHLLGICLASISINGVLLHTSEAHYIHPSQCDFADVLLSTLYDVVATYIHEILLSNVTNIYFTPDLWSSEFIWLSEMVKSDKSILVMGTTTISIKSASIGKVNDICR